MGFLFNFLILLFFSVLFLLFVFLPENCRFYFYLIFNLGVTNRTAAKFMYFVVYSHNLFLSLWLVQTELLWYWDRDRDGEQYYTEPFTLQGGMGSGPGLGSIHIIHMYLLRYMLLYQERYKMAW